MIAKKTIIYLILSVLTIGNSSSQEYVKENTCQKLEESIKENAWDLGRRNQNLLIETIKNNQNKNDQEKLEIINKFYNEQLKYESDIVVWGVIDYWATPLESLNKGAGDCDDYAIGKYFALKKMGIKTQNLRLVYVKYYDGEVILAHMVLTYQKGDGNILILDNLDEKIKKIEDRKDLTPVFSFNDEGVYINFKNSKTNKSLSRWEDLVVKVKKEGW